jgi:hypothetical protein
METYLISPPKSESFFEHTTHNRVTASLGFSQLGNSFLTVVSFAEPTRRHAHGDILETLIDQGTRRTRQVFEITERRGDRAVEGARLEIVCTPNKGTGGSNPPLSAIYIRSRAASGRQSLP